MQDRFKFRLYDKAIGEMVYDVCVGFIKDSGKTDDWVCADTSCGQITYRENKIKDIVLMQCTGLKDKNGKHIYEGDILKNTKTNECLTVAWHNTKAGYVWSKTVSNTYLSEFGALFRVFDKYEIIGNIYENSELLERNNDKTTR